MKYAKAKESLRRVDILESEAREQLRKYFHADALRRIPNLHPYILVFRKDRCVRKVIFDSGGRTRLRT